MSTMTALSRGGALYRPEIADKGGKPRVAMMQRNTGCRRAKPVLFFMNRRVFINEGDGVEHQAMMKIHRT